MARRDVIGIAAMALASAAASGVAATGEVPAGNCDSRAADAKRVVRKALEALAAREYDQFLRCLTDDVAFYLIGSLPNSGLKTGRAAVKHILDKEQATVGVKDYREEVVHIIAGGDLVAVATRGKGKGLNGEQYANEYGIVYRVRNGRIGEITMYLDTAKNGEGGLFVQTRRIRR
jgi:ketosteroid isomerase-like protein